jgi:aspartyl-tRNA(Asn)/glutamyl-tRNA(Gln) amidotransferase subunit A
MTILEAAAGLRARKFSSRELVDESLRRIAQSNPKINAFITITEESARARATQADEELARGIDRGPLHGLPIAHKDLMMTRGVRTTAGSKIFADFVPDQDADVVKLLDDAGAVMVGKTNLHELAYGITSNNPHFGAVRNPWDVERIVGGSSGGSGAALAAGLVYMATGTDTGGSIRIPSSFCGTVGLKPTYERVSRRGVIPLGLTLDHIGPMARTVRDVAVSFNAMLRAPSRHGDLPTPSRHGDLPTPSRHGDLPTPSRHGDLPTPSRQGGDQTSAPQTGYVPPAHVDIRGLRIGLPENFYFDRLDLDVAGAVRHAVQTAAALGARIVDVRVPDMDALNTVGRVLLLVEAVANLRPYLNQRDKFGPDVLALLDQGRLLSGADYVDAQRLRRMMVAEFSKLWTQVDCILTPCTPTAAPKIGQTTMRVGQAISSPAGDVGGVTVGGVNEDVRLATTRLMRAINVLGIPSLAMPCGFSGSGLPLGMQILGAPRNEDMLLRIGAALEDALGSRRPYPVLFS